MQIPCVGAYPVFANSIDEAGDAASGGGVEALQWGVNRVRGDARLRWVAIP
jgi:hypothetical protein